MNSRQTLPLNFYLNGGALAGFGAPLVAIGAAQLLSSNAHAYHLDSTRCAVQDIGGPALNYACYSANYSSAVFHAVAYWQNVQSSGLYLFSADFWNARFYDVPGMPHGFGAYTDTSGNVSLGQGFFSVNSFNVQYRLIQHEIGHLLGLGHCYGATGTKTSPVEFGVMNPDAIGNYIGYHTDKTDLPYAIANYWP